MLSRGRKVNPGGHGVARRLPAPPARGRPALGRGRAPSRRSVRSRGPDRAEDDPRAVRVEERHRRGLVPAGALVSVVANDRRLRDAAVDTAIGTPDRRRPRQPPGGDRRSSPATRRRNRRDRTCLPPSRTIWRRAPAGASARGRGRSRARPQPRRPRRSQSMLQWSQRHHRAQILVARH